MARPLRLELSGGLYHVTARGDGREDIYLGDADREAWLEVLGQVCRRFNWVCHAWCQMSNHYHLLLETPEANLATGMRQLQACANSTGSTPSVSTARTGGWGTYSRAATKPSWWSATAICWDWPATWRLNPLRAKMVKRLDAWPSSRYLATFGQSAVPGWLHTDWVLAQFGKQRATAIRKYVQFVHEGAHLPSVWTRLQGQIYLGSEAFVKAMQAKIENAPALDEIPRAQRRAVAQPLADFEKRYGRKEAMARAYLSGQHTMAAIARHFGVHYSTVSRTVRAHEESMAD